MACYSIEICKFVSNLGNVGLLLDAVNTLRLCDLLSSRVYKNIPNTIERLALFYLVSKNKKHLSIYYSFSLISRGTAKLNTLYTSCCCNSTSFSIMDKVKEGFKDVANVVRPTHNPSTYTNPDRASNTANPSAARRRGKTRAKAKLMRIKYVVTPGAL